MAGEFPTTALPGMQIISEYAVTHAQSQVLRQSALFPPDCCCHGETAATMYGFKSGVVLHKPNGSGTSFVDDVKRCFRGSPEAAEAGCGNHLANPFFA